MKIKNNEIKKQTSISKIIPSQKKKVSGHTCNELSKDDCNLSQNNEILITSGGDKEYKT